ncbi:nucleoplasmin-2a [Carassius auratus]|uniref:Nucleoplasmin-like n=1 Tax=Carassius auratus TaxID=7957 RepID=A0A6P6PUI8_CARAU|nr:nucleoplasmin-like [Carassius auratus]XP_026124565.1 nucleoplasmin-like [Carassius auratus]XP_026124566.1 nucleoplasmin-like [Carassius auratus]XP_052418783.1 nucleoplasmin-2a [Carassius gibelio]XP_052418784.1 nucleoplasmin-2a [Carassius gibelio]
MLSEMTSCFIEDDSVASISLSEFSSSSSVSDRACVHWGCVLSASETTAVFQAENDLLENQFFIKTICLSEEAGDEMHIVAVCDGVGASKPLPIATLRHCMPMISFPGLELIPPVTFKLCSGKGPVFISAQHITLNPIELTEGEVDDDDDDDEDESLF